MSGKKSIVYYCISGKGQTTQHAKLEGKKKSRGHEKCHKVIIVL